MTSNLILAPQGLGDCLEATPMLAAMKQNSQADSIDVVVTRRVAARLFGGLKGYVNDVILLPYWESGALPFVRELLAKRLGKRYDRAFLAYPSARPAYEVLLAAFPAKRRFAHRHAGRMLLDIPWLNTALIPVRNAHNVERNLDLLRAAGLKTEGDHRYLVPADWAERGATRTHRIIVHVGTASHDGLAARRWPLECFTQLCSRLVDAGREVFLVVGPDEKEESEAMARVVPGLKTFEGTLPEVARFIAASETVVANDSGIAHLSAAVGTRVIALFGPTPVEHAPFSPGTVVLRPSLCPPCFDVRTPVVRCVRNIDFSCLKELTVDLVYDSVMSDFKMDHSCGVPKPA